MLIFFFLLEAEKKKKKNRHFQLQQWSLTVAAALQQLVHSFFFLFFFANNQNTPSRHCHNRNQRPKQRCVGSGDGEKKKKVMTKKNQMPTLLISLSTLNHMTSSGKPTSYTCKRAHLISFRRCSTRQTHSACHQSIRPRLTLPLPNVRVLSRASYNLVALTRLRHHSS